FVLMKSLLVDPKALDRLRRRQKGQPASCKLGLILLGELIIANAGERLALDEVSGVGKAHGSRLAGDDNWRQVLSIGVLVGLKKIVNALLLTFTEQWSLNQHVASLSRREFHRRSRIRIERIIPFGDHRPRRKTVERDFVKLNVRCRLLVFVAEVEF